jgi:hypothetical protein
MVPGGGLSQIKAAGAPFGQDRRRKQRRIRMKIADVERINALLKAREVVLELIVRTAAAQPVDFSLMVERGGDGSIRLSEGGSDSTHYQGYPVSLVFLGKLRALALAELEARRAAVESELGGLGVEIE